ncbi:unnamed protein product [Ectocarpus sp. CCAP 1310/34]|nr:unnamed protein product [Ectocarpus sp. CCAP 1310/34]
MASVAPGADVIAPFHRLSAGVSFTSASLAAKEDALSATQDRARVQREQAVANARQLEGQVEELHEALTQAQRQGGSLQRQRNGLRAAVSAMEDVAWEDRNLAADTIQRLSTALEASRLEVTAEVKATAGARAEAEELRLQLEGALQALTERQREADSSSAEMASVRTERDGLRVTLSAAEGRAGQSVAKVGQLEGQVEELRAALEAAHLEGTTGKAAIARARAEAENLREELASQKVALRPVTRRGVQRSRQLQVSAFPLWRLARALGASAGHPTKRDLPQKGLGRHFALGWVIQRAACPHQLQISAFWRWRLAATTATSVLRKREQEVTLGRGVVVVVAGTGLRRHEASCEPATAQDKKYARNCRTLQQIPRWTPVPPPPPPLPKPRRPHLPPTSQPNPSKLAGDALRRVILGDADRHQREVSAFGRWRLVTATGVMADLRAQGNRAAKVHEEAQHCPGPQTDQRQPHEGSSSLTTAAAALPAASENREPVFQFGKTEAIRPDRCSRGLGPALPVTDTRVVARTQRTLVPPNRGDWGGLGSPLLGAEAGPALCRVPPGKRRGERRFHAGGHRGMEAFVLVVLVLVLVLVLTVLASRPAGRWEWSRVILDVVGGKESGSSRGRWRQGWRAVAPGAPMAAAVVMAVVIEVVVEVVAAAAAEAVVAEAVVARAAAGATLSGRAYTLFTRCLIS